MYLPRGYQEKEATSLTGAGNVPSHPNRWGRRRTPNKRFGLGRGKSHFPNRDPAEIKAEGINIWSSLRSCLPVLTSAYHWQNSTGSWSAKEPGGCRTASQGTEEGSEGGGGNVRVNGKYTQQSTQESSKAKRKRGRRRARRAWGKVLGLNRVVRRKWYFRKDLK